MSSRGFIGSMGMVGGGWWVYLVFASVCDEWRMNVYFAYMGRGTGPPWVSIFFISCSSGLFLILGLVGLWNKVAKVSVRFGGLIKISLAIAVLLSGRRRLYRVLRRVTITFNVCCFKMWWSLRYDFSCWYSWSCSFFRLRH